MLIYDHRTKKIGDVNLKKMLVTDNEKFGTRLLRVCIIGQADEPNTCVEKSLFKTESHSAAREKPPPP